MRAEAIVTEEEREAVARQVGRYNEDLRPECHVEADLARWAAVSAARKRRCEDAEQAALQPKAASAVRDWEERRRKAIRRRAQDLSNDPAGVLDDLLGSSFGCEWLIRKWEQLDRPLALGLAWKPDDLRLALLLLGQAPDDPHDPLAAEVRRLAGDDDPDGPSRDHLRAFIADETDRLSRLGDAAEQSTDGPEREAVRLAALVDTSKEGQLRRRYDRDAELSAHRNINLLLRLRRDQARLEYRAQQLAGTALIPRTPVGDGWWCEPNASPAPPGFAPIVTPQPTVPGASTPDPVDHRPTAPPSDSPTVDRSPISAPPCQPTPADTPPHSADSPATHPLPPAPNEAISTACRPENSLRIPSSKNNLRPITARTHPEDDRRTLPCPPLPRPPLPPASTASMTGPDRPPGPRPRRRPRTWPGPG